MIRRRLTRSSKPIVVVGNVNMDAVVSVGAFPRTGENRLGDQVRFLQGGKASNQARALARLGASVHLIGRVGEDAFGRALRRDLAAEGVKTAAISTDPQASTGMAFVFVSPGDNRIISVLGANLRLRPRHIAAQQGRITRAALILVQLGIPAATVDAVVQTANRIGTPVFMDAGPIRAVPPRSWRSTDILSPNESELGALLGARGRVAPRPGARALLTRSRASIILVKLGGRGCWVATRDGLARHVPAFRVRAIDPTGAGDAFCAAFARAYVAGVPVLRAARFACAAGAWSSTILGAAPSLPRLADLIRRFPSAVPVALTRSPR